MINLYRKIYIAKNICISWGRAASKKKVEIELRQKKLEGELITTYLRGLNSLSLYFTSARYQLVLQIVYLFIYIYI
jgi:hypothetical protein